MYGCLIRSPSSFNVRSYSSKVSSEQCPLYKIYLYKWPFVIKDALIESLHGAPPASAFKATAKTMSMHVRSESWTQNKVHDVKYK